MKNKEELFQFEHCMKYHEVLRNKLKISKKNVGPISNEGANM